MLITKYSNNRTCLLWLKKCQYATFLFSAWQSRGRVTGLGILGQRYLSLLCPNQSAASKGSHPVENNTHTDWCQGRLEMYTACSNAVYKSPSSSSMASMPLCRKASFSGDMASELWSCLKLSISVSGDERARAASALW